MDQIFREKIVKKASERIKKQEKKIFSESFNYFDKIGDYKKDKAHVRYMIDNLKLDLDTCTKKSKSYIINKILSLKDKENNLINTITETQNIIGTINERAYEWDDIISDEYYVLLSREYDRGY